MKVLKPGILFLFIFISVKAFMVNERSEMCRWASHRPLHLLECNENVDLLDKARIFVVAFGENPPHLFEKHEEALGLCDEYIKCDYSEAWRCSLPNYNPEQICKYLRIQEKQLNNGLKELNELSSNTKYEHLVE